MSYASAPARSFIEPVDTGRACVAVTTITTTTGTGTTGFGVVSVRE